MHQKTNTRMSRAALRIVAPNWKPKRPVVEWLSCDISYSLREYTTKMKDPCYLQQHGWISQVKWWVKEPTHKRKHILFPLIWGSETGTTICGANNQERREGRSSDWEWVWEGLGDVENDLLTWPGWWFHGMVTLLTPVFLHILKRPLKRVYMTHNACNI